ncbi:MAG TPA: VWA domain-containing protein [Thermoanaerobaculia bacterium]|nr:VWA domain-containing protein [Thermoanaerobaculia bacterium]
MSSSLRLLLLALLVLCLAIPAFAAAPPKPQEVAMPEGLAPRYLSWLDEVALLINPQEKAAFAGLQKDYQRDAFIRRFWDVRDPFPQTPVNELRVRWEERAAIARERFGNLSDDRAHMILFNGEPKEVVRSSCNVLLPVELWTFSETEPIHGTFTLAFVSKSGSPQGPYRLWSPADGIETILSLDLRARIQDTERGLAAIAELCPRGEDIAARLGEALDWHRVETTAHLVPHPSEEWLSTFASYSTDVPEGAPTFPARLDISFPARSGSRTVVQGLVSVPRAAAVPEKLAGAPEAFYSFLVDGEVLLKDELFEHFRYRFTLPVSEATTQEIPVVFQRNLRPGSYGLILKIEDTAGKSYFREQREIEVPTVDSVVNPAVNPAAPPVAVAATVPDAAPRSTVATQAALTEANAALTSGDQTIRLLSPPAGLVTGKLRMEALTTGPGVAKVRFELDGKPVLTKVRPPFSVELNLGIQPRIHRVRALALDEHGNRLAEDEIPLNVGPHRFAVRLTEPQAGKAYQESLRAEAQVDVPEGERLDRVELYLNDDKLATLYQPPFTQALLLPKGKEVTYVRAVAYLEGGGATEDLVLVNSPGFNQKLDVQFVELFTSVVDGRGRPVEGLAKGDFKVFEDGAEQQVRRFERVDDVSIYAGILLDTSSSMSKENRLDEAVQGAMRFLDKVITPKDRAAVITFADHPNLAVRFTNQQQLLAGGLAGLTASGNTSLYDSLIYALYYFGGVKGKRAIILLSDGQDEGSHYTYPDVLEYARRSGVAIYTVGIGLTSQNTDTRLKLSRLADETGGRYFFIEKARELDGIYDSIQKELRSQYLLAYQSSKEGGDPDRFRSVEVKMTKPGLEAKTVRGYYP